MLELTVPCSFCGQLIPSSGVFGLPTYTDVPENHAEDCPIREIMQNRLWQEKAEKEKKMICQVCGAEVEPTEYHPHAFCILIKAGLNPLSVVLDAVKELTTASHKIYLQIKDGDGDPSGEVTWCEDRIHIQMPSMC